MRFLILISIALLGSGCQMLSKQLNAAEIAKAEARTSALRNLEVGMTYDQLVAKVGPPFRTEFRDGAYRRFWSDAYSPMEVTFDKENKISEFVINAREIEERMGIQRQAAAEEAASDQRKANALSAFGASMKQNQPAAYQVPVRKPVNCYSNRVGNMTYTNCN